MTIQQYLHLFIEPITEHKIMSNCYPMWFHGMVCTCKTNHMSAQLCLHHVNPVVWWWWWWWHILRVTHNTDQNIYAMTDPRISRLPSALAYRWCTGLDQSTSDISLLSVTAAKNDNQWQVRAHGVLRDRLEFHMLQLWGLRRIICISKCLEAMKFSPRQQQTETEMTECMQANLTHINHCRQQEKNYSFCTTSGRNWNDCLPVFVTELLLEWQCFLPLSSLRPQWSTLASTSTVS